MDSEGACISKWKLNLTEKYYLLESKTYSNSITAKRANLIKLLFRTMLLKWNPCRRFRTLIAEPLRNFTSRSMKGEFRRFSKFLLQERELHALSCNSLSDAVAICRILRWSFYLMKLLSAHSSPKNNRIIDATIKC